MARAAPAADSGEFRRGLLERLAESDYVTLTGRVNLAAFARDLDGVSYDTLLRILRGSRPEPKAVLEECARVLRVKPELLSGPAAPSEGRAQGSSEQRRKVRGRAPDRRLRVDRRIAQRRLE